MPADYMYIFISALNIMFFMFFIDKTFQLLSYVNKTRQLEHSE
jgi:hypothetical protein